MVREKKDKYKYRIITVPNILSMCRIALIPVIIWLYCGKGEHDTAGYVLLISGFTDILDGLIARGFNMVSNFGKLLDPIADKLTQISILFCLLTRFPLAALPLALLLIKESVNAVQGAMILRKTGGVHSSQWHGKLSTLLLYAVMLLHFFWVDITPTVSNITLSACALIILVSFILYTFRNMKILRDRNR